MLNDRPLTGNLINAYFICKRKVWLYAHEINPVQESSYLELGKIIAEESYERMKKEVVVGNMKFDIIKKDNGNIVVGEVKKSSAGKKSAKMQLAFYLSRLKEMGIEAKGELLIPKEKRKIDVELNPDVEKELQHATAEIKDIISLETSPEPEKNKFCTKCDYRDFC